MYNLSEINLEKFYIQNILYNIESADTKENEQFLQINEDEIYKKYEE